MLTHDDYERVSEIVKRAARGLAKSWPGIDGEDIEQEIWVGLVKDWSKLPDDDVLIRHRAWKHGLKYCHDERYFYTLRSAEWVYTPSEVRALFRDCFFDPVWWEDMPTKEADNSLKAGGVVVLLWDLRNVWESLSDDQRDDIGRVYRDHVEVAPAERKACQRAVDVATEKLNRRMEFQTLVRRGVDADREALRV